jgi:ATP-binding cassette subfamily F protein 3
MIQVDGLTLAYHGEPLFEDASFSLQPRERCALVGLNGSGKSSLFRMLLGKETPNNGTIAKRKHYSIGSLDQHIVFSSHTLIDEAALGLRPEEKECIYKAESILLGLGFQEADFERSPQEFSGGYQLRLHLAKVLLAEPDCLLLDEPTNYLDIVSIRWFTKFLSEWSGEFILISHDREFLDSVCTHTMGIHRKKVSKVKGNTQFFFEQIAQKEEIHEKTKLSQDKKRDQLQGFIDRFGAKASKATQAASKEKALKKLPQLENLGRLSQLDFKFNEARFPGKKMLEVSDISFSYTPTSAEPLIENFALSVEKGERIAIIGKNGRGKSTLLRILSGDLNPLEGDIKRSDNLDIGYFGQTNIDRLHPNNSIEEEISSANPKLNYTQIKGICGLMMFSGDKSNKTNSVLSGGEKSRVLLGKILAKSCNCLFLDEPTHHLDMESIEALVNAIQKFEGAVIIVTHSEQILKQMALHKIVVCHQGKQQLFLGTYEEFLEKNGWQE